MLDELLETGTGVGAQWWMDFIGSSVSRYTHPTDNPLHGATESNLWLRDLADEVWVRTRERHDLTKMDENIICSSLMSLILTLWSNRIRRAKSYDPRRPLGVRRAMQFSLRGYQQALLDCMVDESRDHEFFPQQEWDLPYAPNARDGDFI